VRIQPYTSLRDEASRLWTLGWPVSVGMGAVFLMGTVDILMVGGLGQQQLAALAVGNLWCFGLSILGHSSARGLDPIVAQAFGAGDRDAAGQALLRGWLLAVLLALPLMALHTLAAEGLGVLGQPEHLLPQAEAYARARMWGLPFAFAFDATRQFLQGLGVMKPATRVAVAGNLVNAALNGLFLYGFGLGVEGAGWATAGSMAFLLVGLLWQTRGVLRAWWPAHPRVFAVRPFLELVSLALPAGFQSGLEVWGFIAAGVMMGWLGEVQLDAHVIALNLATLAFTLPFGLSAGAATRVGNLLGAGYAWQRSGWVAVGGTAVLMLGGAALFVGAPVPLARLFTREPSVVLLAATLLPIAGLFQVFDGTQTVAFGVLRGAGDVRVPTLANLLAYYVVGLPLGYWLAFERGWGAVGIWVGLTVALGTVASLLVVRLAWLGRRGGVLIHTLSPDLHG